MELRVLFRRQIEGLGELFWALDLFSVGQAGKFLAFAHKDDLVFRERSNEVFRLTWLRRFHEPVMVLVEAEADGAVLLTLRVADGQGGQLGTNPTLDFVSSLAQQLFARAASRTR